ncbi:hypothetical protein PBRA_007270 [Plasmodiophora brassicae]|nr:hypothetical protein PBRA_007270 [Plasmodiophora brassicae]
MASGVLDWLRWSMTQDAWVYAKAPMSWYPSGAPRSMHPTIDDLAWAIPCAIVLSVFRAVATRLIYKPAAIHFLSARNKSEPVAVKKFTESAFKCTAYIVLSAQGLTIQFREKWLLDTSEYWRGWPQVLVPGMRLYYITELSLYLHLLIAQFFDTRRKDFVEMFIHHIVTIPLIVASYCVNFERIGGTIMIVHDLSDVFLEAAKLANYANARMLCDSLFVAFAIVFFCTRLVILPWKIMYTIMIESLDYVISPIGWPFHSGFMAVLIVLHVFWFQIILRMVFKFLRAGSVEGDDRSDDEDEECTTEQKKSK